MSVSGNQCNPPTMMLSVGERDVSGFEPVRANPLMGRLREWRKSLKSDLSWLSFPMSSRLVETSSTNAALIAAAIEMSD